MSQSPSWYLPWSLLIQFNFSSHSQATRSNTFPLINKNELSSSLAIWNRRLRRFVLKLSGYFPSESKWIHQLVGGLRKVYTYIPFTQCLLCGGCRVDSGLGFPNRHNNNGRIGEAPKHCLNLLRIYLTSSKVYGTSSEPSWSFSWVSWTNDLDPHPLNGAFHPLSIERLLVISASFAGPTKHLHTKWSLAPLIILHIVKPVYSSLVSIYCSFYLFPPFYFSLLLLFLLVVICNEREKRVVLVR